MPKVVNSARGALLVKSLDNNWIESVSRAPARKGGHAHYQYEILKIITRESEPIFIIDGDFNGHLLNGIVKECPDIVETDSPPTRNGVRLDLAATNVNDGITGCYCVASLQSLYRVDADHETRVVEMKIRA